MSWTFKRDLPLSVQDAVVIHGNENRTGVVKGISLHIEANGSVEVRYSVALDRLNGHRLTYHEDDLVKVGVAR